MALSRVLLLTFAFSALAMDSFIRDIPIERITGKSHAEHSTLSGLEDFALNVKPRYYNPSIVQYSDRFIVAVRDTILPGEPAVIHGRHVEREVKNFVHLCVLPRPLNASATVGCSPFDPWQGRFFACVWDEQDWGKLGPTAFTGIDDTKLFVWPGKGLFALVTRRAEAESPTDVACKHINFMEYLAQVIPETTPGDAWHMARPLPLRLNNEREVYGGRTEITEKNWMPFVYNDELYITYHVVPRHMVYKAPSSTAPLVLKYATESDVLLRRFPAAQGLHGGPPVIFIPANMTSSNSSYYLGIVHFKKTRKDGLMYYPHYFYKTQPVPPFRVTHVAYKRVPLQLEEEADKWRRRISFVSGHWLQQDERTLYVSYGMADRSARLVRIPVAALEEFFRPAHGSERPVWLERTNTNAPYRRSLRGV